MPYHLDKIKLRVVHKYVNQRRNRFALGGTRLIVLEHILPTTEEFLRHLSTAGAEIFRVIAKPYSIDDSVEERLVKSGFEVVHKSYHELETTEFLDELIAQAVELSKQDGKQILILEVGGYFAEPLARLPVDSAQFIASVVEDTTFGHNRYIANVENIRVPVFSVARSTLKEIEAHFVGRDVVAAVESVLRHLGVSVAGRRALVIGYGMIGSSVARALRTYGLEVLVYDKHDHRNLTAFIDGCYVHKKRYLLEMADIIFAATADRAMTYEEIEDCKDNVILVSAGSKDTEFEIAELKAQALRTDKPGDHVITYDLSNSKRIVVIRDGTAVNFLLPSMPAEILDLVFAEILICGMLLLKRNPDYPPGVLYQTAPTFLNSISKDWLRCINVS
jgi:adenosylhomocysteinase